MQTCRESLILIDEDPVLQFERQEPMDITCMVRRTTQMFSDNRFHLLAIDKGSAQCSRIEQHLANVICQLVPIPDPVVAKFVSAQKKSLQMQQ